MFSAKSFLVVICCLFCFQTARSAEWTTVRSGTLAWLHDVYFFNGNKGFVAGSGGTLLATNDGGKSWEKRKIFIEDTIEQIHFTDENNGWLLCQRNQFSRGANASSYLMKTIDGGASWEKADFTGGRERIAKIFSNKSGLTFAVGESGVFFVLQDDFKTWKRTASASKYLLLDGDFTGDFHAVVVGAASGIFFSEDAGASWNKAFVTRAASGGNDGKTKLNRVFFVNKNFGWTVGGAGRIYQTVNGGKSWREQTSNTTHDLTDVYFLNTAEGWAVGDGGAILHTTTGGNIWTPMKSTVNRKIERVFFVGEKGFAVGFGGTILSFERTKTNGNSPAQPQSPKRSNKK